MLSINNLSYYIGDRPLYEEANLHIKPKDKIGLIGLNGTGKSTLLRLITGEYTPDGGEISYGNDCSIGFLNQDLLSYQSSESILSVAMGAFAEALYVQEKINETLKEMETNYRDELVDKLAKLQEKFEAMEGYTLQSRAEEILEGIGFRTEDLERPLQEFSGGWRMRVMLAKLLLEKPSLLMLDEPTNHLDLPSIQWVENYLRNYEGAIIVVSHDRQFLDNTITSIVEVSQQQLNQYSGNYTFFVEEKAMRDEIQQNAFENQQQKIKQTERFIERFRSKATKARQVQSRVKALEKMDRVEEVTDTNVAINFDFRFNQQSGKQVMELEDISKGYGDLELLESTDARIMRGDKIALIGANGKGKSTLLRIIFGMEKHAGLRKEGYNVITAFFAQHQLESLNIDNEIIEELKQAGSGKTEQELRAVLGCFLFSDEEVHKKIKVLSGGEKSRVALAKTIISEANFLMLDEPTNHLDMISENILIQALQQYQGTYVVVSHNRHFINEVANKIWYIEDKEIKEYPGTYKEYLYWRSQVAPPPAEEKKEKPKKEEKPSRNQAQQEEYKELQRSLKKLQKSMEEHEQQIAKLEKEKKELEEKMAKPDIYGDPDKLLEVNEKYDGVKKLMEEQTEKWESVAMEIDEMEEKLS
ncbi:ABC-F family ATP-binding cassette domain-containing protein [Roseivirga sp. BDSF3-8]|uniref:ABC-F family ATP-binding cassette domain-containing protein n=1 Tax=Roseivirga sp. BDSF3-8 TaxID=3241598 RepID=UPI00353231D1